MDPATIGTVALAILSGAGGSALLEIWWRPWRDRKKAAGMLLAEIAMNTELLLIVVNTRKHNPKHLPADLHLTRFGWDAATPLIPELPTPLVRSLVLLYNRYRHLNDTLGQFLKTYDEYHHLPAGSPRLAVLEQFMASAIDVYQTGVDSAVRDGQEVLPQLARHAGWSDRGDPTTPSRDYAKEGQAFLAEREERVRRLGLMGKPPADDK